RHNADDEDDQKTIALDEVDGEPIVLRRMFFRGLSGNSCAEEQAPKGELQDAQCATMRHETVKRFHRVGLSVGSQSGVRRKIPTLCKLVRFVGTRWLICVREFVANTPDRKYQLWVVRVLFNLRSQAVDVGINRSVIPFVRVVPDFFEQVLSWED